MASSLHSLVYHDKSKRKEDMERDFRLALKLKGSSEIAAIIASSPSNTSAGPDEQIPMIGLSSKGKQTVSRDTKY